MQPQSSDDRQASLLATLRDFYAAHGRHDMLWRQPEPDGTFSAYRILVSEVMLQQTQVGRVAPKYLSFLREFPTADALAEAPLSTVLAAWSGLGYNRRAKYLQEAARAVRSEFDGRFPDTSEDLVRLPGVGPNTAGALLAYVYNQPVVFLETNIRTVLIYHFYTDDQKVADSELRRQLAGLVPPADSTAGGFGPRQFYWALMDYGSWLKKTVGNKNQLSKSYTKQAGFEGSVRQLRGKLIRALVDGPVLQAELLDSMQDDRTETVLSALERDGLVTRNGRTVLLA